MMNRSLFILLPILAACGGGGDGAAPVAQTPAPAPVAQPGVVTDVATPSYTSGTEELAAFNLLNQERSSCGFGKLAQNTKLDSMARGHADWVTYNKIASHYQTTGSSLFTGVTPEDRANAVGYSTEPFVIQDEFSMEAGTYGNDKAGYGVTGVRRLLNAPYHALGLVDGYRDVGISLRNAYDSGAPDAGEVNQGRKALVINPARLASQASQLAGISEDTVLTYPCQGSTGVNFALYGEMPNPVPGRNLLTNPLGSSVQIAIREGNTLAITSASMVNTSTQAAVTLRTPVTGANDPYPGYFTSNRGYIAADAPLAASTTYTVTIAGMNNGVAFTKTFNFTTGS